MSSTAQTTSSGKWPETVADQASVDVNDRVKFGRVASLRPGDLVVVQPPGGGSVVIAHVINSRVDGGADAILASTVEYGRRWWRVNDRAWRLVGRYDAHAKSGAR